MTTSLDERAHAALALLNELREGFALSAWAEAKLSDAAAAELAQAEPLLALLVGRLRESTSVSVRDELRQAWNKALRRRGWQALPVLVGSVGSVASAPERPAQGEDPAQLVAAFLSSFGATLSARATSPESLAAAHALCVALSPELERLRASPLPTPERYSEQYRSIVARWNELARRLADLPSLMLGPLLALLLGACASAQVAPKTAPVAPPAVAAQVDEVAVELSRLLPSAADRCVIGRPARLSHELRAPFSQLSQAEAFVWREDSPVEAFASATRTRGGSGAASVLVLRVRDAVQARAFLAAHSGLDLRWQAAEPEPCPPAGCPTFARMLDARTVVLVRGRWPEGQAKGVERSCRALGSEHANAVEVAVRRSESLFIDGPSDVPIETRSVALLGEQGLTLVRTDLMASGEAAARELSRDAGVVLLGGDPLGARSPLGATRTREDLLVHTTLRLSLEDLGLRADDAARTESAQRYASLLGTVRADAAVDFARPEDVLRELRARALLIAHSSAPDEALRAELSALLERGLRAHPEAPSLLAEREKLAGGSEVTPPDPPAMTPP